MDGIDFSILEKVGAGTGSVGVAGVLMFLLTLVLRAWMSRNKTQEHADNTIRDTITTLQEEVKRHIAREIEMSAAHEADLNRISELQVQVGKLESELAVYKQLQKGE